MAASLVESLSGDFDPSQYHDEYREQLLSMIDAKVSGGDGVVASQPASDDGGEVVDLLTALRESLARAGAKEPEAAKAPARKTAAKKPAAKAAPAKKAPAKKAAAKKAPAQKTTAAKKAPAKRTRKTA